MEKAVRRDMHKMTAFLRFRRIEDESGEHFVAWFEPEHFILRRISDFFVSRFAAMRWSILTPQGAMHWDGTELTFSAGVSHKDAPAGDALEDWWRTYYRATFNPARANVQAMRAEMPKKYWRNMPETDLIPGLLAEAENRTREMVDSPPTAPRPAKGVDMPKHEHRGSRLPQPDRRPQGRRALRALPALQARDADRVRRRPGACRRRVRRRAAGRSGGSGRQAVRRPGRADVRPRARRGRHRPQARLRHECREAFKFEPRGKRRIHKKPNNNEIEACRWWLDNELELIKPQIVVALGATAARALTGRDTTISRSRGKLMTLREGLEGFITVHPSFLLRLPDEAAKAAEYKKFVADLKLVAQAFTGDRKAA